MYFVRTWNRGTSFAALQITAAARVLLGACFGIGAASLPRYFLFEVPSNLMLARVGAA